jgi:hypothetical protein
MRHHQIASTTHIFLHGHYPLAIMPLLPLERLDHLLRTRFCLPCKYHPNKFDNLTSFFCLDCLRRSAQALCAWCLAKHAENTDHRILQARSPPSVSFHHQGTTPTKDTREKVDISTQITHTRKMRGHPHSATRTRLFFQFQSLLSIIALSRAGCRKWLSQVSI